MVTRSCKPALQLSNGLSGSSSSSASLAANIQKQPNSKSVSSWPNSFDNPARQKARVHHLLVFFLNASQNMVEQSTCNATCTLTVPNAVAVPLQTDQSVPFVGHLHVFHENILLIVSHGIKLFEVHRTNHGTKSRNKRITVIFYCVLHFDVASSLKIAGSTENCIYIYAHPPGTYQNSASTGIYMENTMFLGCCWSKDKNINTQNVAIL